jgi:hypothetical protein
MGKIIDQDWNVSRVDFLYRQHSLRSAAHLGVSFV